ncbi:MAG: hypothetical protein QOH88_1451 [Verrucomicrobiota bacterium]|jgi:hypothetical protein
MTSEPNEERAKQTGPGLEKPPEESSEVVGHKSRHPTLTCSNCGALNYYEPCWHYVTCWRCGTLNWE